MSSQSDTTDANEYNDPSAVILPHVETDGDVVGGYNLEELVLFVPACVLGVFGLLAYFAGNLLLAGLLTAPAVFGGLLAMYFSLSSKWYAPPRERVKDWIAYLRSRRSLPWGHDQAIGSGPIHGVRSIRSDGTVECRDGRYALALPVMGTNADQVNHDIVTQLVGGLRTGVNIDLKDDWFAYYSTSRPDSNEERATSLEDRVLDTDVDDESTPFQEALLLDAADWLRETDEEWSANDWQDFIEIQVFPHEYDATQAQIDAARESDDREGIGMVLASVSNAVNGLFDRGIDITEDDSEEFQTPDDVFEERVGRVEQAVATIDGVRLGEPSPATAAELLLEHWTGGGHVTGNDLERLIAPERDVLGEFTPAERLLTPGHYDNVGTTMLLDDTLARTFWISDWPMEPDSLFLRDLHTMEDINLSVRIIAQPEDKRDVVDELEITIAQARGEEQRRDENQEVSSLAIVDDIDALERAYHCLQQTNTQPWRLSGYVTVRAESKSALKEDSNEVKRLLESYPAGCTPIAHGTRQKETFASCAPFAPDVFEHETSTQKAYRALSGAFGAMFPFVRTAIHDPLGIRWGRNTQTGQSLWADPFDRGTAPHLITLGKSRGGKTYGVSTAVTEWWLADDDRTLILCDTQGGFDGVTELLDGDHIVVDSSNGVNPFYIQSSNTEVDTEQTAFGLKVDEVTEFIAGILRAQDIDPGQYRPTIQLAVQETYKRHGISNEKIPEDPDCPTIGDFLDTLDEMVADPGQFSHTKHEAVAERRKGRVADLLEKLTGFMESGKYSHLVDETSSGITADTEMAYLDLRHFEDATDAEKSVHLHLMLSQVSQLIKRTPGETIFLIDEAHLLLHSEEMLAYLQSATREWARYQAAMWFVSQSPQEFVRRSSDTGEGQENHREVILEQCSTTQVFYCGERIKKESLIDVGLFPSLVETAKRELTPGKAGKGYSECLLKFDDETGWMRMHVEAPPLLDLVLNYKWHEHGDFVEYLREHAGDDIAQLAAESREAFVEKVVSETEETAEISAEAVGASEDVDYIAGTASVQQRTGSMDDALRANGHGAPTNGTNTEAMADQEVDDGST